MALINQPPNTAPDTSGGWKEFFSAIFFLLTCLTQSGTTAQRPVKLLFTGRTFFDTTLGKPIWYKTAGWVDATGAPA